MFAFLLLVHVAGYAVWLGSGVTFMIWGPAARDQSLEVWAHSWTTLARLQRAVVAPACIVTTLTGIVLSMSLVQRHFDMGSAAWLMAMQGLGLVAAALTLGFATPLAGRMGVLAARSLEKGVQDPSAESVRKRLAIFGSLSGVCIIVATYFGVLRPMSGP